MKNSCLYACEVMHHRLEPKPNKFVYKIFMFGLDLGELDDVVKGNLFISRNRFNLFNFRDRDHLQLPKGSPDAGKDVRAHILDYITANGVDAGQVKRIFLITNLCTLGYQFNPVSFYFCYDAQDQPICSVVEVCNTYREMKTYFLGKETLEGRSFRTTRTKNFYVSPFIDLDADFQFNLNIPGEKLAIAINDEKEGKRFFYSTLTGTSTPLTNWSVLLYAIRFPLITLQVITLIHWQALRLWLKKLSFHRKASSVALQQDVLRPHKSIIQ